MTNTENLIPAMRWIGVGTRYVDCPCCHERRRIATDYGMDHICAACLEFSSQENTHSDDGHDQDPSRGLNADGSTWCPICAGHTEVTYAASFWGPKRSRKATGATAAASTVAKDGHGVCSVCRIDKPATKYPTKKVGGEYVRDMSTCRTCR